MDRNLEKNCISALKSFVDILRDQAAVFTGYISELNSIVGRMENLSPKLTVLENREENGENDFQLYPIEMVEKITGLILSELNDNVNRAHELIQQIGKSIDRLYESNQEFTSAANAARLMEESAIVRGTYNRKPLDYYVEESCILLHAWKKFYYGMDAVWRNVNCRELKTIEMVKRIQQAPLRCQELMNEYLLYCSMITTNNKRSK